MNTAITGSLDSLSLSINSNTLSQSSRDENNSASDRSNHQSTTHSSSESASTFSDSFEFSSTGSSQMKTYLPVFQPGRNTVSNTEREDVPLPASREELDKIVDQRLTDYYGIDTEEHNKYKTALDKLEAIDPELAEKALFLITLLGKEEADKFLSDVSEFTSKMQQTSSTELSINVVAQAESSTLNTVYEEMMSSTRQAVDRYTEIISERFNIDFNIQTTTFTQEGFCDPLVFDLDGDGIDITTAEAGVEFDIDGDGRTEQTAFIQGDDALLYLDRNGNGTADNGKELFGDQEGDANGFEKLSKYDENHDGKIDELDTVYSKLRLWQDKNHDGVNQEKESISLLEAGIKSIQLKYNQLMDNDKNGNIIAQTGEFTRTDGTKGMSADMLLRTQQLSGNAASLLFN